MASGLPAWKAIALPVAGAFHSPLMASAAERGTPWPAELAGVMEEMHRVAKRGSGVARGTGDRGVAGQPGSAVPGW